MTFALWKSSQSKCVVCTCVRTAARCRLSSLSQQAVSKTAQRSQHAHDLTSLFGLLTNLVAFKRASCSVVLQLADADVSEARSIIHYVPDTPTFLLRRSLDRWSTTDGPPHLNCCIHVCPTVRIPPNTGLLYDVLLPTLHYTPSLSCPSPAKLTPPNPCRLPTLRN